MKSCTQVIHMTARCWFILTMASRINAAVTPYVQACARYSLPFFAPILSDIVREEDAEAGRDSKPGVASGKVQASSKQPHRNSVPMQIQDVPEKSMAKDLVQCDICFTSIANLHR